MKKIRLHWTQGFIFRSRMDASITIFEEHNKSGPYAIINVHICVSDSAPYYKWESGTKTKLYWGDKEDGFMYKNWDEL